MEAVPFADMRAQTCPLLHQVLRQPGCAAGGGLFTSTNPESRRVVPQDPRGRTKLKVVYVVLEAQYQSALTAAVRNINLTRDQVCLIGMHDGMFTHAANTIPQGAGFSDGGLFVPPCRSAWR